MEMFTWIYPTLSIICLFKDLNNIEQIFIIVEWKKYHFCIEWMENIVWLHA